MENMKKLGLTLLVIFVATNMYAVVSFSWTGNIYTPLAGDSTLTESDGTDIGGTAGLLFQAVIDVNTNSSIAAMASDGFWEVGTADDSYGTADDYVVDFDGWVVSGASPSYASIFNRTVNSLTDYEAPIYIRWFNGSTDAAGEAGIIYNASWQTPVDGNPTGSINFSYNLAGNMGSSTADIGGYSGTPGWATMAPIPEPGTLALLGIGALSLLGSRKKKR